MNFENIDGIIQSCRNLMRKDKGMNTDAQRIPQLLWMLFLKCFDDFELQKEVLGEHKPIIEEPYRWRDWTNDETGRRGDELIEFVNNNLFKYLSDLQGEGTGDQRDVIADVFREQKNFMTDGYGMKSMIQQINKLDFTSSKQFYLIGSVYEKMLSSMRDDSPGTFGEFYTPRPVIKFMVNMINPSLKERETILDPACGTAGFLIESFSYLEKKVKGTPDNDFLQKHCLSGIEPRPEPYLFSMMNMMLHGIEEPHIDRVNTLETKLSDIKENLQHDIIMTNPPFGGEEQDSIKKKFPGGFQTKDTALGFLLHCMARLKDSGRCAIILPNGPLFVPGIAVKIRKKLLDECNLHTIVRLPKGVFEPYADIPTNLLFFDKSKPTKKIWYYQIAHPEGKKTFTKTQPITSKEFESITKWWKNKEPNDNAWQINVNELSEKTLDLDIRRKTKSKKSEKSTSELIENTIENQKNTTDLFIELKKLLLQKIQNSKTKPYKIGKICKLIKGKSPIQKTPPGNFPLVVTAANRKTSNSYQIEGPSVCIPIVSSTGHGHASIHRLHYQEEKFALGNILIALQSLDEKVCNNKYLFYLLTSQKEELLVTLMKGSANVSLTKEKISNVEVQLPDIDEQIKIVDILDAANELIDELNQKKEENESHLQELALTLNDQFF
jgi:type I restriction enzyme M protein